MVRARRGKGQPQDVCRPHKKMYMSVSGTQVTLSGPQRVATYVMKIVVYREARQDIELVAQSTDRGLRLPGEQID